MQQSKRNNKSVTIKLLHTSNEYQDKSCKLCYGKTYKIDMR